MVSNRFLEINGVRPPAPKPATPPKPAPSPVRSARFLEINGVKPVLNTTAGRIGGAPAVQPVAFQQPTPPPPPQEDEEFLRMNGVQPRPRPETPQAGAVDNAVQALETAIDQRNAVPPFARRFLQDNVTEARDDLEEAIRDEIEETHPPVQVYMPPLDIYRTNAGAISDRYADDDTVSLEVDRAVENVVVDFEVEDTLDQMSRAPSDDQAFDRLTRQFGNVSERAQVRLVQEEQVEAVLDAVTAEATQPLAEIPDADFPQPVMDEALFATYDLTQRAAHPDLAAEIVTRVQPALDQALMDHGARDEAVFAPNSLLNYGSRTYLGWISDSMTGARKAETANADLAGFVLGATTVSDRDDVLVPVNQDGSGVALDVAVIRAADADPDINASFLVDRAIDNYDRFLDNAVVDAVDDYANHTEELNFYVAGFPGTPEQLQDAIGEYVEGKGPEWEEQRAARFREVALLGERIYLNEQLLDDVIGILPDGEDRLAEVASEDVVETATNFFLNDEISASTVVNLEEALDFASALSLGKKGPPLLRKLANASLQNGLRAALIDFDPRDPASLRSTANTIRELGSEEIAAALDIPPEVMAEQMEDLAAILDLDLDAPELRAQVEGWEADLDNLDKFSADSPVGRTLRGAGAIFAAVTVAGSWRALADDPTANSILRAGVDSLALAQSSSEFYGSLRALDETHWTQRLAGHSSLAKILGVTGLGLSVPAIYNDFAEGDLIRGGLGTLSFGGAATSLLLPKTRVPFTAGRFFGPVGAAASVVAGLGSLGWDQFSRVQRSNDYTGDAARAFLSHAGLDGDATRALVDRSGEGFSPVPILMDYAQQHGLTPEQAIDWLNGMEKSDLDLMRDIFHKTLDNIDGDLSQFLSYSTSDRETIAQYERILEINPNLANGPHYFGGPANRNLADWIFEYHGLPVPTATG